jgi:hypothetical protein
MVGRATRDTPLSFCRRHGVQPGDLIVMTEPSGRASHFTIDAIDEASGTVRHSLPGVWINREWVELAGDCEYEHIRTRKGE